MRVPRWGRALVGLLPALGRVTVVAQSPVLVTGATVIDGTGAAPIPDAVIVIEGNRITAVGPRTVVAVPSGARRIDAAGKFVIPGLMDANVHLILMMSIEFHARYEGHYEDLIEEAAQVTLRNGVTTVFDSWGPLQPLMSVRDRIKRGEVVGSRIFVAGNIVGLTGPLDRDMNPQAAAASTAPFRNRVNAIYTENVGADLLWKTPDQVRTEVRKYIARGIDFLKYAAAGHGTGNLNFLMFSPEAQRAIVEEAHRAGIIAQTHTESVESLRQAIEAGIDMGQHMEVTGPEPMPESTLKAMLDRKIFAGVQPMTQRRLKGAIGVMGPEWAKTLQAAADNEVRMLKAGVPLLMASDGGLMDPDETASNDPRAAVDLPFELHEGPFLWLRAMGEKGMKPMDALMAATRNVAAAYHKLDQLGTLEKGKIADLVVLDADPLADLENVRKISMVMKEGRLVDRDKLPLRKFLTAPR